MQSQATFHQLPFCFPKDILSQDCRFGLTFCTCLLVNCESSLLLLLEASIGSQPWGRGWVWVTHGALGPLRDLSRGSSVALDRHPMECLMQLVGFTSPWNIQFQALAAVFPAAYHPQVMQLKSRYAGWGEREMGFFGQHPTQFGKLGTHSHTFIFLLWEKSQAKNDSPDYELCCFGGGVMQIKLNSSDRKSVV